MSWSDMWRIILQDVKEDEQPEKCLDTSSNPKQKLSKGEQPFLDPLSKHVDREALSKSKSAVELNRVANPNYSESQQKVAIASNDVHGAAYLSEQIDVKGALFLIKLKHNEGEFAVGLGRRTFNEAVDLAHERRFEVEWFERKNKKEHSWGKQPGFRRAIGGYTSNRRKLYLTSVESLDDFLPLNVKCTKKTKGSDEPVLTQETVEALRLRAESLSLKSGKADRKAPSSPLESDFASDGEKDSSNDSVSDSFSNSSSSRSACT